MKAPGPTTFGVLRQMPLILGDRLAWLTRLHREHGDVVRVSLGGTTAHAVFHPDLARYILTANAGNYWKGRTFQKTAAYLGRGLATAEGQAWQSQRRRMNPHFQRDALRGLVPVMVRTVERLLERWRGLAQSGALVDLSVEFQRLTMETVARTLFGNEVPDECVRQVIAGMRTALSYAARRTMIPFDLPGWLPLPGDARFRRAVRALNQIVYRFIDEEERRDAPSSTLLSLLVQATDPETGERMSREQLRDEVMTLLIGGTDTSGHTLGWVLYNLNRYPHVRQRLEEEVGRALGGRPPTVDDLDKLSYTGRIIEETLRLFPQNWVMSRDALAEDMIGGYTIPAKGTVFIGTYIIHRRPDFWDEPETFDPDRFLPERSVGRHTLSYFPFGAGQRKCIGYQFAMNELRLAVAMLVQNFDFTLVNPTRIKPNATWSLWPWPGLPAVLRPRR